MDNETTRVVKGGGLVGDRDERDEGLGTVNEYALKNETFLPIVFSINGVNEEIGKVVPAVFCRIRIRVLWDTHVARLSTELSLGLKRSMG